MATLASQVNNQPAQSLPRFIPIAAFWNLLIVIGSVLLARSLFADDSFRDMGDAVQSFIALMALVPALLGSFSIVQLLRSQSSGRYATLALNYIGMVLAIAYLLNLWGFFLAFDDFTQLVYENAVFLWLLVGAYALFWVAGRFGEGSSARKTLEQFAVFIGMAALITMLVRGGILDAAMHVLDVYTEPRPWIVTLVIVICGVIAYEILKLGEYFGETPDQRVAWQGWLMVSPNVIGFFIFFAGPLLLSFYFSFTNSRPGVDAPEFIELANYREILSLQIKPQTDLTANPQAALSFGYLPLDTITIGSTRYVIGAKDYLFWITLRNTLIFCLMLIPFSTIPALLLSVILNSKIPGMKFFRAIYFLPSVAAVVGTAIIWSWLYNANIGYINYALTQFTKFFGLADPQIQWLSDPGIMLFSIVLLAAWQLIGFNTVLFLAGLQGIPNTLYEASFVDGANRWQQFWHITLPLLAPTTFFVVVTTVITGLQVFNEPYALFTTEPLPQAAQTSVYHLYSQGFRGTFEFGYASAVAWVLFALIFMVTLAQFRAQKSGNYEY